MRIASYTVNLDRDGPGILLRDIRRGKDKQIAAILAVIGDVDPDILVLKRFDWDYEQKR